MLIFVIERFGVMTDAKPLQFIQCLFSDGRAFARLEGVDRGVGESAGVAADRSAQQNRLRFQLAFLDARQERQVHRSASTCSAVPRQMRSIDATCASLKGLISINSSSGITSVPLPRK